MFQRSESVSSCESMKRKLPSSAEEGAPKGEPDRAKPQSMVAGVVLIKRMSLLTNTTPASASPQLSPPQLRRGASIRRKRVKIRIFTVSAILMMIAGANAGAHPAPPTTCAELAALKLPDTTITRAEIISAGSFAPPPASEATPAAAGRGGNPFASLPSFCRVIANLKPANDSDIGIEVWLPMVNWNGKFQASGGASGASVAIGGAALTSPRWLPRFAQASLPRARTMDITEQH